MDKRTKVKTATTIVCLLISILILYRLVFVSDITGGGRTALIIMVIFWIISGIISLIEYFGKRK